MKRKDFSQGYHERLERNIKNYGAFSMYLRYITLNKRIEAEYFRNQTSSPFQFIYEALIIPEEKEIDTDDLEALKFLADTIVLKFSFAQMLFGNQVDFKNLSTQQKKLLKEYAFLILFMKDTLISYIEELQSQKLEYAA